MALRLLLFVQGAWGFRGAAPRRAARVALGATVSERLITRRRGVCEHTRQSGLRSYSKVKTYSPSVPLNCM